MNEYGICGYCGHRHPPHDEITAEWRSETERLQRERGALLAELDRKAKDARAFWGERDQATADVASLRRRVATLEGRLARVLDNAQAMGLTAKKGRRGWWIEVRLVRGRVWSRSRAPGEER